MTCQHDERITTGERRLQFRAAHARKPEIRNYASRASISLNCIKTFFTGRKGLRWDTTCSKETAECLADAFIVVDKKYYNGLLHGSAFLDSGDELGMNDR